MWERWERGEIASPYNELLTYDSEMRDGGHLQFFLNRALRKENMFAVMSALRETLPAEHAENVSLAYRQYCMLAIDPEDDASVNAALGSDPLYAFDAYYDEHEEEMIDALEAYAASL